MQFEDSFPDWRAWLSGGYGPGNTLPKAVTRIRDLEKQEESIKYELIERGESLVTCDESAPAREHKRSNASVGHTREAFLKPILDKRGFSVNEWAIEAGVDFHTAKDYFSGETKPYPSTITKLAKALGDDVRDMPGARIPKRPRNSPKDS
jgi:hypothetical protein